MIDKYDLLIVLEEYMPELKTLDRQDVLDLINNCPETRPRRIQAWAITDDTPPLNCGAYDDITDFRIPIKLFKDDVTIEFEDDTTN